MQVHTSIYLHVFILLRIEKYLFKLCGLKKDWYFTCVSKSMRAWILKNYRLRPDQVHVLYDRPNETFRLFSDDERRIVHLTRYLFNLNMSLCRQRSIFSKNLILFIAMLCSLSVVPVGHQMKTLTYCLKPLRDLINRLANSNPKSVI